LIAVTTSQIVVQGANWPTYEAGLRRRCSLTFWIEDSALEQ
jgi:hypothetical protein